MVNIQKKIERVRAVIIISNKILLINRIKNDDSYWVIPGGRVESDESHEQAIKRECIEELGIKAQVERLFLQRISDKPGMKGQHEFFYLCSMVGGKVGTGEGPEFQPGAQYKGEYRISWVDLKKLSDINLKPLEVKDKIIKEYLLNK